MGNRKKSRYDRLMQTARNNRGPKSDAAKQEIKTISTRERNAAINAELLAAAKKEN